MVRKPALRRSKWLLVVIAGALCATGTPVVWSAPAPVEELSGGQRPQSQPPQPPLAGNAVSELFAQLQMLQEEVRELRGKLEEQSHQLSRLEQQQKDNYLDLDGRLSALMAGDLVDGGVVPAPETGASQTTAATTPTEEGEAAVTPSSAGAVAAKPAVSAVSGGGDKAAYDFAYELLKQGRMDDALAGFEAFARDFPDSALVPNAIYWMGEIYLVKNDQQAAMKRFTQVVDTYPAHQKSADAHYKLGTLHLQLGDKAQARAHLERAALAGGSVAVLAKRYLETHF